MLTEYFFTYERSPDGDYAETDAVGGAVQIYLAEFNDLHEQIYSYGDTFDDIVIAVLKAVLIHEDIHVAISQIGDTNGNQEHDSIYRWIQDALS